MPPRPLSSGEGAFFEHGEFRARLDELRDACSMPGRIVVLTGPAGAGKSLVCEALLADLGPGTCTASVSASESDPFAKVLVAILEAYGFKVEPGTRTAVMSELIAHHAGDPARVGRRCVIVLDDAHELPLRDLSALVALVDGSALTLLIAGPANLLPTVERIAEQFSLDTHEVRLAGLSVGEVSEYLEWRQSGGGIGGRAGSVPVGDEQVKQPARRPRSLPGPLDQLVAKLRAVGSSQGLAVGPFGFPLRHLVLLGVLALVLLLVYIVGQVAGRSGTSEPPAQQVETIATPPLPESDTPSGTNAVAGGRESEAPAAPPSSSGRMEIPERQTGAGDASQAPRPIIARQTPNQPPVPGAPAGTTAAPGAPATASTPLPAAANAPAPAPATPTAAPAQAAATPSRTPATPASPAAPASTPRTVSGGAGPIRTAEWIMAQPAASYTVQLVSLSSAERARTYIAEQPDPGSFATYRLLRNGQLFHVVVYGAFTNKAQATQAATRLSRTAGNVQPWIRQFGQVQESVRTTAQQ